MLATFQPLSFPFSSHTNLANEVSVVSAVVDSRKIPPPDAPVLAVASSE